MKSIPSGFIAASALISLVTADAPGTLGLKIVKNRRAEKQQLQRRAGTVMTTLDNYFTLYTTNITIGTPPQSFTVDVDTGSSDLWVPSSSSDACTNQAQGGCPVGSFDSSKSSTFTVVGRNQFNISYVDGSGASGDYFEDTMTISGATLRNFEMGLASTTTIPYGLIGISYSSNEANVETGNGTTYPNLVDALVSQGAITTQAYSLWLDDAEAATGSLLFGGIDTKKYTGQLTSVKVYPSRDGVVRQFAVALTSVSMTSPSGTDTLSPSNFAVAAILDSGTSLTYLPSSILKLIISELGASFSRDLGYTVPCSRANVQGSLNFGFEGGAVTIKVPINELVFELTDQNNQPITLTNGQPACGLGVDSATDSTVLLGDTFLRSAYVVYDLANNRIGLAQTDFNATDSNVVAFASQGAAIPSASSAAAVVSASVTESATGIVHPTATKGASSVGGSAFVTSLAASGGFISGETGSVTAGSGTGATGAASSSQSAAGQRPAPFAWDAAVVLGMSVGMMVLGGGVFALL